MNNLLDDILQPEIRQHNKRMRIIVFIVYMLFIISWCVIILIWFHRFPFLMPLVSPLGFIVGPWSRKKYPTS
jgi:CHASE2 domain-containing sensor protein